REFGFTVVAAVLFSLLVSFTLTPLLSSRWLKEDGPGRSLSPLARFGEAWDRGFGRLEQLYRRILAWSLDHRKAVAAISLSSILVAVAYFPLNWLGTEFVPNADQGQFTVEGNMPAGTTLIVTAAAAHRLEGSLQAIPEIDHVVTSVGTGTESAFQQENGTHLFEMTVLLKDKSRRSRSVDEVLPDVNRALHSIPGLNARTQLPNSSGSAQPLILFVQGDDSAQLTQYGAAVEDLVRRTSGTTDITNSRLAPGPELDAVLDHARADDLGVTAADVGAALRTSLTGDVVSEMHPAGQKQVDVRLMAQGGSATTPEELGALPLPTSHGGTVRVDQVARLVQTTAIPEIDRRDRQYVIRIGASLDGSRPLGVIAPELQSGIEKLHLPRGYHVDLGGDVELQNESIGDFGVALGLGMLFVFMLMAALFESLVYPLAVMFSVPVSLFGAFTALAALHENLGLFSMIGLIMLFGLVTKNAILVIDFTEKLRADGSSRREALLRAGPVRLRPILMTSATLVVSMIPLALKITVGSEFRAPIGAVVGGGMISSTLLSLILVPVAYSALDDLKLALRRRLGAKPQPDAVLPLREPDLEVAARDS
ncbi:MAG: efflux RND transporter permease subunit, partial [Chloroflexi bacterium]|nr:efflux RND transporter permease subunit [Chloroflexota bacterium]